MCESIPQGSQGKPPLQAAVLVLPGSAIARKDCGSVSAALSSAPFTTTAISDFLGDPGTGSRTFSSAHTAKRDQKG